MEYIPRFSTYGAASTKKVEYILGFGQIDDSIDDVLDAGNRAQRRQSLQEFRRIVLMQWRIDHAGRNRVETDTLLRVFDRQVTGHGIEAALGNHRHRNIQARDRLLNQRRRDADNTATRLLSQH